MSQQNAFQRLLDLVLMLTDTDALGVPTPVLLERVGYADNESGKRALMRDLDILRANGLDIRNLGDAGADGRYLVEPSDVRMRIEFSPEQRTALTTALAAASTEGTVAVERKPLPVDLDRVREAVRRRCVMYFFYNGKPRTVDPESWEWSGHDLVVTGYERATDMIKSFAVARMEDLEIGAPGSAEASPEIPRPGLDPITWEVDPPVDAVLSCPGYCDDVIALVGGSAVGDEVHTTVTNRLLFLARVVELGERVRLTSPDELRNALRDLLLEAR